MDTTPPPFNLKRLVDEVISSCKGVDTALKEVEMCSQWVAEQRPVIHSEVWDSWFDDVFKDCREVTLKLLDDREPTRIQDIGRIVIPCSNIISPKLEALTRLTVGRHLLGLGKPEWALDHLVTQDWSTDTSNHIIDLCLARVEALVEARRPEESEPLLRRILECSDASAGILAAAMLLRSRAHLQSGRSQAAVEDAHEAVDRWKRLDDAERKNIPPGWHFFHQLGEATRTAGDINEAIAAFEFGRQVAVELGHVAAAAFLRSEIGFTWQRAGDNDRGALVLRDAAREAESLGENVWASRWIQKGWLKYPRPGETLADKLARANAILGEPSHAAESAALFRECLREAVKSRTPELEHAARNGIATAYRLQGQLLQAQLAERQAIKVAEAAKDVTAALGYRINLSWILILSGRINEAEEEAEAAIKIGEQLRDSSSSTELRQTIGSRLSLAYEVLALCYTVPFTPNEGAGPMPSPRPERLFAIGQQTRAVNLTRWLALGEISDRSGNVDLSEALIELREADIQLEASAEAKNEPLAPLTTRQRQAKKRWDEAACRCGTLSAPAVTADVEELTRAFPDRLFVDLLSLEEGVTINGFHAGGRMTLDVTMSKRRYRLGTISEWHDVLLRVARSNVLGRPADDIAANRLAILSAEVDDKIMGPIARCIERGGGPAHLTIFPHRELFLLPFWRLESMLQGTVISLLPGPAAALILDRRARSLKGPWVAFRDVTDRLAHVDVELQKIPFDERLMPSSATVLDRAKAAALIHFACHGYFDFENPYRSGLLALDTPGDAEDPLIAPDPLSREHRILTIAWIFGRLCLPHAHTLILSACQTGLPRQHPAGEFTSLPAALLVAGSRNVIASLWPAHDAAAKLLMEHLYQNVAKNTASWMPSEALAHARRQLINMGREEARERLAPDTPLPPGEQPFAATWASDVFQHYGVD